MKRVLLLMLVLCLMLSVTAIAEEGDGLKGKMFVSAYAGYALGFGDVFDDVEYESFTASFDAGIGFGGAFHYGVTPKFLIGGEIGMQSYEAEVSILGISASETNTEMNILASGLYALNYVEGESAFFLAFGGGLYGGAVDDEMGVYGGVLYAKKVGEKFSIFVMPRFHYVMSDPAMTMVQVAVGATLPLGSK